MNPTIHCSHIWTILFKHTMISQNYVQDPNTCNFTSTFTFMHRHIRIYNIFFILLLNWYVEEVLPLAMPKKNRWEDLADGSRAMEVVVPRWIGKQMQGANGHLPSAWRVPYKRVYPRSKAGDTKYASILMHGNRCMPQAAALKMGLWVPARNEWIEWMTAPHGCDICP